MRSSLIHIEDVMGRDAFDRATRKVGMEQDIIQCTLDHLLLCSLTFDRADLVTDTDYPHCIYTERDTPLYKRQATQQQIVPPAELRSATQSFPFPILPVLTLSQLSPHTISPVSRAQRLLTLHLICARACV